MRTRARYGRRYRFRRTARCQGPAKGMTRQLPGSCSLLRWAAFWLRWRVVCGVGVFAWGCLVAMLAVGFGGFRHRAYSRAGWRRRARFGVFRGRFRVRGGADIAAHEHGVHLVGHVAQDVRVLMASSRVGGRFASNGGVRPPPCRHRGGGGCSCCCSVCSASTCFPNPARCASCPSVRRWGANTSFLCLLINRVDRFA